MTELPQPYLEMTSDEEQVGQVDSRRLKELRNAKRGLEIRLCNLSTGRSEPRHAGEADEVRSATVELQAMICEVELASTSVVGRTNCRTR